MENSDSVLIKSPCRTACSIRCSENLKNANVLHLGLKQNAAWQCYLLDLNFRRWPAIVKGF